MSKKLSEMSLEELWQLFPIFLVEHQNSWEKFYEEELTHLQSIIPNNLVEKINHIGSTAIKTICAKPIIDIIVEVSQDCNIRDLKEILINDGYLCMSEEEKRISLNKGYTDKGFQEKVYHIHLRYLGDNDELYFRDYLNENPDIAKKYEKLKLELWKKFEHNRDGYTNSKTEFIKLYTNKAKEKYKNRY